MSSISNKPDTLSVTIGQVWKLAGLQCRIVNYKPWGGIVIAVMGLSRKKRHHAILPRVLFIRGQLITEAKEPIEYIKRARAFK